MMLKEQAICVNKSIEGEKVQSAIMNEVYQIFFRVFLNRELLLKYSSSNHLTCLVIA